jgi:hypothetical protein
LADASQISSKVAYTNSGGVGDPAGEVNDRTRLPGAQSAADKPLHILKCRQAVDKVSRENTRAVDVREPLAIPEIVAIGNQGASAIGDVHGHYRERSAERVRCLDERVMREVRTEG